MRNQSAGNVSGMKRGEVALLALGSLKAHNLLSNHRALSDARVIFHGSVSESDSDKEWAYSYRSTDALLWMSA